MEEKQTERRFRGEALHGARKRAGLSQEELAERLAVSRQAVSKWESGQAAPSSDKLPELAAVLGATVDELFGGAAPGAETPAKRKRSRAAAAAAAAAALLTVGALILLAARLWQLDAAMAALTEQVSALTGQVGGLQAQLAAPQEPESAPAVQRFSWKLLDYNTDTQSLVLSLQAAPRTMQADTQAAFLLIGDGEPITVPARAADWGGFTAEAVVPFSHRLRRVDLLLRCGGVTTTETAGSVSDLSALPMTWSFSFQGQASRFGDRDVRFDGQVLLLYDPVYLDGRQAVWPVSAEAVLTQSGKTLLRVPLERNAASDETSEEVQLITGSFTGDLCLTAETPEPITLTVSLTDNFGHTSRQETTYFESP